MAWWEWGLATRERSGEREGAAAPTMRRGRIGTIAWEARVTGRPVSYGMNPRTLLKGQGRVTRLVVYQQIGRAEVPHKLALYDGGWQYGRKHNLAVIQRVMAELEREGAV